MKYIKLLAIPAIALSLASCSEDFLDRTPTNALAAEAFWQTEKDAQLALTGCYRQLQEPYSPYDMWRWEATSDNGFCFHNNQDYRAIGNGSMAASGVSVHNYFTYIQIRACNDYLINEKNIKFSKEETRQQYRDEIRMIRALSLFFRVQCYGDFPFEADKVYELSESRVPRQKEADNLSFIIKEMEDIATRGYLPAKADAGRITIGAAQAFLMRVYLFTGDYNNARKYAEKVMSSQTYSMPELSYDESFQKANQYNSEMIMTFEHSKSGGFATEVGPLVPNSMGGWSSVVPTRELLDAYETINGLTIDEDATYDPKNPFANRDPRLRATILYPGQRWGQYENSEVYPKGYASIIPGLSSKDFCTDANNATHTGLSFKKFYNDPRDISDIWSIERNFPILRYAEVLLSYAEAKIELNDIDESVYSAINQVRHRAGLPAVDRAKYGNQEKLRELVRRERRVEFAYEGMRRWDLIRWGIAKDKLNGQEIWGMKGNILTSTNEWGDFNVELEMGPDGVYGHYGIGEGNKEPFETRRFTDKNKYLPVPQSVIDVNNNITQNPGY